MSTVSSLSFVTTNQMDYDIGTAPVKIVQRLQPLN
jgi:hypothetical protein